MSSCCIAPEAKRSASTKRRSISAEATHGNARVAAAARRCSPHSSSPGVHRLADAVGVDDEGVAGAKLDRLLHEPSLVDEPDDRPGRAQALDRAAGAEDHRRVVTALT
jgi:hypothetical protein